MLLADLTDACGDDPSTVCRWVFDLTDNRSLAEVSDWFIARPLRIVVIMAAALVLNVLMRRAISRFIERLMRDPGPADGVDPTFAQRGLAEFGRHSERTSQRVLTLGAVLRSLASLAVFTIAGLMALGELNINLGPLIAGAGIAGIAIGFGAQSLVKDFLAGMFVIIEDQYGVGDIVDLGEASGTVEKVTLRSTTLRDQSGTVWVVPNGEVTRVGNLSQLYARSVVDFTVPYEADLDDAAALILSVATSLYEEADDDARIIAEPEILGIERLGPDGADIRVSVTTEPSKQFAVSRRLRAGVKAAFDDAGIDFPAPRRVISIESGSAESAEP